MRTLAWEKLQLPESNATGFGGGVGWGSPLVMGEMILARK